MRMSIGVPGVALYFEHDQVKPFLLARYKKVVPAVIKATCKVLEVVANNTADAHDYLIGRLKTKQAA
jgi:hypothetical protein